jgi:hypothetical protein
MVADASELVSSDVSTLRRKHRAKAPFLRASGTNFWSRIRLEHISTIGFIPIWMIAWLIVVIGFVGL